jgi:hypothetical protein
MTARKSPTPTPESNPMPPSDQNTMILGEMRGQLREVVHTINNLSVKFDGLSREVIGLGPLAADMAEMKLLAAAQTARIAELEGDRDRREGASGIVALILKSPALGWFVGVALPAAAILSGKVHLS